MIPRREQPSDGLGAARGCIFVLFLYLIIGCILFATACTPATAPLCLDTTWYTDTTCKNCVQVAVINPCTGPRVTLDSVIVR